MTEEYNFELIDIIQIEFLEKLEGNIHLLIDDDSKYENIIKLYLEEYADNYFDAEYMYVLLIALNNLIEDRTIDLEDVLNNIGVLKNNMANNGQYLLEQINTENKGYVYLMVNPSMNGIVKIGLTRRMPEERLDELSKATGVPTPFILVYKEQFNDCVKAEKLVHTMLEQRGERVSSNREFFSTDVSEAIKIIQEAKTTNEGNLTGTFNTESIYDFLDEKPISKEYLETGIDYLNGYGEYLQDYDRAIEYLEKAGGLGEAQAYFELGQLYIDITKASDFNLDVEKSIKYFEKGRMLTGMYANYCNAGLALCYLNPYFYDIENYTKHEANALKCWEWFFNKLDINDSNGVATSLIMECIEKALLNEEYYEGYRHFLEKAAYDKIKLFRYELYETYEGYKNFTIELNNLMDQEMDAGLDLMDENVEEAGLDYLIEMFGKPNLTRTVEIKYLITNEDSFNEGSLFEVEIQKGMLKNDDILSFKSYSNANRLIKVLKKNGEEVTILNEGQTGIIKVSSIIEDLGGFVFEDTIIKVIGNDKIDVQPSMRVDELIETESDILNEDMEKIGLLGKVRKWFS